MPAVIWGGGGGFLPVTVMETQAWWRFCGWRTQWVEHWEVPCWRLGLESHGGGGDGDLPCFVLGQGACLPLSVWLALPSGDGEDAGR